MNDYRRLSDKELENVAYRINNHFNVISDKVIQSGMGHMAFSEIVDLAKGSTLIVRVKLAQDYLNARRDWYVVNSELDRRNDERKEYENRS